MIEHHCRPSDWIQGAIGIVHLSDGQGQWNGGWHIVFWQSETEWDRFLSIEFCPYCGQKLSEAGEGYYDAGRLTSSRLVIWIGHLVRKWFCKKGKP